ncbi:MAG: trypsin-like peptidase domain-containing protein [Candidatus Diapherotrites archaeon]|nr:trypsin-like peptidase domain-containing protein [Candidatus Diapherotrites archaeon]
MEWKISFNQMVAFIFVVLFVGLFGVYFSLSQRIDGLSADNALLSDGLQSANSLISGLQSENNFLSGKAADASLSIRNLNSDVGSLFDKTSKLDDSLATAVSSLEDSISVLDTKSSEGISSLGTKLESELSISSDTVQKALQSTVQVKAISVGQPSIGSGAIITSDGYIITNNHVIENATIFEIKLSNSKVFNARRVSSTPNPDLALLKIDGNFTPMYFEQDMNTVKAGNETAALGSPSGLDFTVTKGIISSALRFIDGKKYIQIDTPVNPGNSGGPIINKQGRIIGIVTSKFIGQNLEGLGFAIPGNIVKNSAKQFITLDKGDANELDT